MAFVQVIEFRTTKYEEFTALDEQWRAATEGKRTVRRSVVGRDRHDPNHYLVFVFFDDYDAAMVNSNLPETAEFASQQQALADGAPTFVDLDVLEDRT